MASTTDIGQALHPASWKPPLRPGQELAARVVSSAQEFRRLEEDWAALHEATGSSVFQSWDWQWTWWKHFGRQDPRRALHIVLVEGGGQIAAIAPFFIEKVDVLPGLRLRRLSFLGTGLTDYLDLVVRRGFEEIACDCIAAHLASAPGFDVCSLADISASSPVLEPLRAALERHGLETNAFVCEQCPRTVLKGTWKETLETFDHERRRKRLSRIRQLRKQFDVALDICSDWKGVGRDVEEFMGLHQAGWSGQGKKGVYADRKTAAFQRAVAQIFFRRGELWLAFLRVNGARIAAMLGFIHRGEMAHYLNGLGDAGEAARFSPGTTLTVLAMEELNSRGVRVYDFLRGTEEYKYEFAPIEVPNWALISFRKGARLARIKHSLRLLRESLGRRVEQERIALQHLIEEHGLFSAAAVCHLVTRLLPTMQDSMKKLRSPERSLTAEECARRAGAAGSGADEAQPGPAVSSRPPIR
ncbi:MAG TPA: GNAT family N-acetyltransferase [Myxococcales bacterium]|nr:GNAT family N-acetyltransferase [Myxococcales bacterium]